MSANKWLEQAQQQLRDMYEELAKGLWRHEHEYSKVDFSRNFRCRCGHEVCGDDIFTDPNSMLGKYWRENYPTIPRPERRK